MAEPEESSDSSTGSEESPGGAAVAGGEGEEDAGEEDHHDEDQGGDSDSEDEDEDEESEQVEQPMPALGGGSPSDEAMVDYVGNMMEQEFGIGIPHHDDTAYIEVPAKITALHNVMNNGGKLGWTCLHCSFNCKGPFNATKLKAHLARIPGQDVRCCTATQMCHQIFWTCTSDNGSSIWTRKITKKGNTLNRRSNQSSLQQHMLLQ